MYFRLGVWNITCKNDKTYTLFILINVPSLISAPSTFFVEKVRNSTKIGFKPRKYPIFGPNFVTIGLLSFSTPGTFIRINTVTAQLTLAGISGAR